MKLRLASAAGLIVVATVVAPAPASAAPAARFGVIQYDPPGKDTPVTNAKLNAEHVVIRNPRARAVQLKGFKVRDAQGHVYTFGRLRLGPGKAVRLHTGSGANNRRHRYCGQQNYVWNNGGDTARLINGRGVVIDRCKWTSTGTGRISCR